jgi:hypothetical protein
MGTFARIWCNAPRPKIKKGWAVSLKIKKWAIALGPNSKLNFSTTRAFSLGHIWLFLG